MDRIAQPAGCHEDQAVSVFDVATYILDQVSSIPAIKLQKLVYYSQAWSLIWDEKPLFDSKIEAWAFCPVVPELYETHKGQFLVKFLNHGNGTRLDQDQRETVDAVLDFYSDMAPPDLNQLTHFERPWQEARIGLQPGERGHNEITWASMAEYYSSL